MIENEKIIKHNDIFNMDINASNGNIESCINFGFAIIPSGIKYKPMPKVIEVIETFIQFSSTIPAAINTVPQTGGVIVDNKANQKTNK